MQGGVHHRMHPTATADRVANDVISKMFHSAFTHLQYIGSLATCSGFLQNHLQAVVNYRQVHPVYAHIMGSNSVYIKS